MSLQILNELNAFDQLFLTWFWSLYVICLGESPSSSASDVDNLNHPVAVDKVAFAKGVGSPQVAGNHVIAARHRPNFVQLLSFVSKFIVSWVLLLIF